MVAKRTVETVLSLVQRLRAADVEDGTFTTKELAKHMTCGEAKARRVGADLIEAGQVEACYSIRKDPWGRAQRVPAYRLLKETEAKQA